VGTRCTEPSQWAPIIFYPQHSGYIHNIVDIWCTEPSQWAPGALNPHSGHQLYFISNSVDMELSVLKTSKSVVPNLGTMRMHAIIEQYFDRLFSPMDGVGMRRPPSQSRSTPTLVRCNSTRRVTATRHTGRYQHAFHCATRLVESLQLDTPVRYQHAFQCASTLPSMRTI
jgi:hypothetical protein